MARVYQRANTTDQRKRFVPPGGGGTKIPKISIRWAGQNVRLTADVRQLADTQKHAPSFAAEWSGRLDPGANGGRRAPLCRGGGPQSGPQ